MGLDYEDLEEYEDIKKLIMETPNCKIDGFLIIIDREDGETVAFSSNSVELYDSIHKEIEINRKLESGELSAEDAIKILENEPDFDYLLTDKLPVYKEKS